jgi:hypothetical protein
MVIAVAASSKSNGRSRRPGNPLVLKIVAVARRCLQVAPVAAALAVAIAAAMAGAAIMVEAAITQQAAVTTAD